MELGRLVTIGLIFALLLPAQDGAPVKKDAFQNAGQFAVGQDPGYSGSASRQSDPELAPHSHKKWIIGVAIVAGALTGLAIGLTRGGNDHSTQPFSIVPGTPTTTTPH